MTFRVVDAALDLVVDIPGSESRSAVERAARAKAREDRHSFMVVEEDRIVTVLLYDRGQVHRHRVDL